MLKHLAVSRPRFWIYVFGPALVGATAAITQGEGSLTPAALALGLYFTLPANLLIYGVNDIFDYETDAVNTKKQQYEPLVARTEHRALWRSIALTNLPFVPLLFLLPTNAAWALLAFLFLGIFYSAPPIRAKARPFFDSAFNALYIMPGLAAYFAVGGGAPSLPLVIAAILWAAAMHAYSAVPDIAADTQARIATIATTLGRRTTLLLCLAMYLTACITAGVLVGPVGWAGAGVYGMLMLRSLRAKTHEELLAIYKQFPTFNTLMGALLFFSLVLK